jgi:hypothetical protein
LHFGPGLAGLGKKNKQFSQFWHPNDHVLNMFEVGVITIITKKKVNV